MTDDAQHRPNEHRDGPSKRRVRRDAGVPTLTFMPSASSSSTPTERIDLYTDGDIDRARKDRLDDEAVRSKRDRRPHRHPSGGRGPPHLEELVAAWEEQGINFQRRLIQALLHPIVVDPARTRKRAFDPSRLRIEPKA